MLLFLEHSIPKKQIRNTTKELTLVPLSSPQPKLLVLYVIIYQFIIGCLWLLAAVFAGSNSTDKEQGLFPVSPLQYAQKM